MRNKKYLLMFLTISLLAKAEEYNGNTTTVNNWTTVDIHDNGTEVENTSDKIKYEFNYNDGDVIGTKNRQPRFGGNTINKIIDARNRTLSTDPKRKDITGTTIKTPGKLNIIHIDDGTPIDWQVGVQVYNSNSKHVERSETILNFDTELNVDITTHRNYSSSYYSIFNVFDVDGQGNSSGDVTKPVSTVNLLKKTTVKTIAQSIPDNPNLSLPERRVNVFFARSNGGGESHLTFKDDLTMESKSTTDNLQLTGIRLQNEKENRFKTVSTKDTLDKENGGSTVTFEGNVDSVMTGDTTTKLWFLANTQIGGGVKVTSKAGKTFTSKILNTSTDNKADSLNLYSKTTTNGESKFLFNSNTNLITSNKVGSIYGVFLDAESNGKNTLEFNGDDNKIETSNEGASAWVYGIKTTSTNGENNIKLKNTNITTNSNYVARSIEIGDENLGKNNFEIENTNINTVGNYSYGINLESDRTNSGSGENTINFKGYNTFHSIGGTGAWGFRIVKNKANTGEGTKITSDKDSTLNIVSRANTSNGIYLSHEKENNKTNTTFDGKVNIEVLANNEGYGIYHKHSTANNITNTVFNNDTVISITGNGNTKMAVYNETPENAKDDSKSIISFNKKLAINGAVSDPALVSTGKNAEITVAGKDDVNILGNIYTSKEGKVTLNLLNENSYLVGLANNNGTGTINMKLANSSDWLMTTDSKINDLDISSGAKIQFSNTDITANLSIDNLKGTGGILKMQGNVQTGEVDSLSINKGSEGEHYIEFENMAGAKSTGTEYLKVVESLGEEANYTATFKLKNPNESVEIPALVERGAYLYNLGRASDSNLVNIPDTNKNNWYLYPNKKKPLTPGGQTNVIISDSIYHLNLVSIETLVQRMGEIHFDKEIKKNDNVWAKTVIGEYSGIGNVKTSEYSNIYFGIKAGYDKVRLRKNWINYNGISLGYMNSKIKFSDFTGASTINTGELGVYSTWLNKNNNVYFDFTGKIRMHKLNADIKNYSNEEVKTNGDAISYMLSAESGKRIFLKKNEKEAIYIQPEMQLAYQFIDKYSLDFSNGLKAEIDESRSLIGRLGLRAGIDKLQDKKINFYGKLMYEREFLGNITTHFNGVATEKFDNAEGWFTYGLGATYLNKEKGRQMYLEVQRSTKHKIQQNWQINFGFRYTF